MAKNKSSSNFIEQIINGDLKKGLPQEKLKFRFPPEPNGYLHLGHAKAICLNFDLAKRYNAPICLRFDDTNPEKEEQEYVDAIKEDIQWLGFNWDEENYTSDYFQQLYDWAIDLIKQGKAYVDDQSSEEITEQRKTPFEDGVNSPYRERSIEDNLSLFEKMKNGEFVENPPVLRAKIDMSSPNMNMRDPVMYRVLNKPHHRTGTKWNIYPMYDWAHGQSDYIENISHSLCSLEFENHRPLYNWYKDQIDGYGELKPVQREFARGNVSYMITSKRKLRELIDTGAVSGWDDPRMPTLSGLRRRGYTPESIRLFWEKAGISKRENLIDISLLEYAIKDQLNQESPRVFAVLDPIKLIIENYPEDKEELLSIENNPEDPDSGEREVPFTKELYIERSDFKEEASKKFFRLTLDKEVRLKGAYIIKGTRVEKDEDGNITTIFATYDVDSKSGSGTEASQRRVKGTLHWVSAKHNTPITVRKYDRLFTIESPEADKEKDFKDFINKDSLTVIKGFAEPSLRDSNVGERFQFQRLGYYIVDKDSNESELVFNQIVPLRDNWKKK